MANYNHNPRSNEITSTARKAFGDAGMSVQGQLPRWLALCADPGKTVFWRDGLIQCGVDSVVAFRIVEDLDRAKRGW